MNSKFFILFITTLLTLSSCIETDIIEDTIEPTLRINNPVDELIVSDTYLFQNTYLNNIGTEEDVNTIWVSSDQTILSINPNTGQAIALKTGVVTVTTSTTSDILITSQTTTVKISAPSLRINNPISVLSTNENYTFTVTHFNTEVKKNQSTLVWSSSDSSIISINATTGLATGLKEGKATIFVQTNNTTPILTDEIEVDVMVNTFKINNPITTLDVDASHNFTTLFTDANGTVKTVDLIWTSSDSSIIRVNASGIATALKEGNATITVTTVGTNPILTSQTTINVPIAIKKSSKSGTIKTTSSYLLEGDFTLEEIGSSLVLKIANNYKASTALPGLFVYLGNNPNTISNAYEIGAVTTFNGAHSYTLPSNIKLSDYKYVLYWCKPFGVKVGDGEIK